MTITSGNSLDDSVESENIKEYNFNMSYIFFFIINS
ncbi:hypothetical protein B6N60_02237 [Richelia sinica FACHB-800]|uniref:Uncharacterized protein n=1 Tax=Richelia sinica FACHB-800 TaxID=1357546 RepID=A0A975Y4U9_9NOST|nr:hypothetical protein B6N60_02237 [Richelia sinica FACHB-800]